MNPVEAVPERLLEESPVFCMLPWTHLSVLADGRVLPCCTADGRRPVGHLRESSLRDVWNSSGLREVRRNMLAGKKSPHCEKCYEMERNGLHSGRREANRKFARHFPFVGQTRADGSVREFRLPYLDVKFSNLCNFRCRYCLAANSTSWYAEMPLIDGSAEWSEVLTPAGSPRELWSQLEPLIPHVEEIYFAGGEPLIIDDYYALLDALVERKMFQVRLRYNTNFSATVHKGRDVMEMWSKFEHVEVDASLDAMGARGEYIRKGQNWNRVLENRERLRRVCPRVVFRLTPTLSVMNVLHFPDFFADWLSRGYLGPVDAPVNVLLDPIEYRIQVLPETLKRRVEEKYESFIERALAPFGREAACAIDDLRGAMAFMRAQDLTDRLDDFRRRTRILDDSRGERFEVVFPELTELF